MSKNRSYLLIITSIALVFGVTYLLFQNKIEEVKQELKQRSTDADAKLNVQKETLLSRFNAKNPNQQFVFDELCDLSKAVSYKDTTINYFLYSTHLEVQLIDEKYLECVFAKAQSDAINERSDLEFEKQVQLMVDKHGSNASRWSTKLGKDMFMIQTKQNDCSPYFEHNDYYTLDPVAFSEFDRFLAEYKVHESEMSASNSQIERQFKSELTKLKGGLSAEAKARMDENINDESALTDHKKTFSFNWKGYGEYSYSLTEKEIDFDYIEESMEDVYEIQYRNYSLANGSMPYAYCYGRSNSGGSGVRVNAGSSDVLVTVKDMNDRVIRHAFIKANRTFTLNIPNGNYNVYFYYGTGWNPKRFMKDTDCGRLVGGFLRNESVSKDPGVLRLYDGIMVYTLTTQVGGNFSTAGSSKTEAF